MLNIVVINCDDKYVEYEWNSMEAFVSDIESNNEIISMLDDALAEINTDNDELHMWWRDSDGISVNDLYKGCKQKLCQ